MDLKEKESTFIFEKYEDCKCGHNAKVVDQTETADRDRYKIKVTCAACGVELKLKKHAGGRPTLCNDNLIQEFCSRIMQGESVNNICKDENFPNKATICDWLARGMAHKKNKEDEIFIKFYDRYAQARAVQAEILADEMNDIADDGTNDFVEKVTRNGETIVLCDHEHIQRSKLRVETRRWNAERLLPKRYGVVSKHEHTGKDDTPLSIVVQPSSTAQPADQKDDEGSDVSAREIKL